MLILEINLWFRQIDEILVSDVEYIFHFTLNLDIMCKVFFFL